MTTLRQAIHAAIREHGEQAIWGDGGTDWTLDNYTDATIAAEQGDQLDAPAYYDGKTIRLYRPDGTIDNGEALLRLVEARWSKCGGSCAR